MRVTKGRRLQPRRARPEDDRGVTIILMAGAMVALLLMVALVIDLSNVRDTRQTNKSAADVAVAAGMRGLANPDGKPRPWGGVCKALDYLKLNLPSGSSITGTYKNGAGTSLGSTSGSNPCDGTVTSSTLYGSVCVDTTTSSWAWFSGTADGGKIKIDIKSGYSTLGSGFSEDQAAYSADNTVDPRLGSCAQLAVILEQGDPAFFGGAVGASEYGSRIRSVGRVTIAENPLQSVALLLLDPTACRVLWTNGSSTFVLVKAAAPDRPGFMQVNSDGSGCGGGSRVIEGSDNCAALTACLTRGPSIVAQGIGGVPGTIGDHAVGGAYGSFANTQACIDPSVVPTGTCTVGPVPEDKGTITRAPVDDRYLSRVETLEARATSDLATQPSDTSFYRVNGNGGCNSLQNKTISAGFPPLVPLPGTVYTGLATKVFVNCDFDTGSNMTTVFDSSITEVVVKGTMSVGSGGVLRFDGVRKLYVAGSGASGVNSAGTLMVNGVPPWVECPDTSLTPRPQVTEMVIMSGRLTTSGGSAEVHLCNTFVFLADGNLPTTSGTDPRDHTWQGGIDFGAQTILDWSAPNQTNAQILSPDPRYDKFEDLALWTESGDCRNVNNPPTRIGGQGDVSAAGVFFLPNACFQISGGGFGAGIGADAQFVARRLELSGTTQLSMAPNPANVVPIPYFDSFRLVR